MSDFEDKVLGMLGGIVQRLDVVDRRLDGIGGRLDAIDRRLDAVVARQDSHEEAFDHLNRKIDRVEKLLSERIEHHGRVVNMAMEAATPALDRNSALMRQIARIETKGDNAA